MKKGFTLIELLVVIAVIAMLCGILFPVFSSVRAKANQSKCLTNLMQIGMAVSMYCSDSDQRMMPCISFAPKGKKIAEDIEDSPITALGSTAVSDGWAWSTILYPYTKDTHVFECSNAPYKPGDEISEGVKVSTYNTGYAINANITGGNLNTVLMRGGKISGVRPPLCQQIKKSNQVYLIADGAPCGYFGTLINGYVCDEMAYIPAAYNSNEDAQATGITENLDDLTNRHVNKFINMLYVDGHADHITGTELLNEINLTVSGNVSGCLSGF